jgi:hypothetical protein
LQGLQDNPQLAGAVTRGLGLAVPAAAIALTPQIAGALVPGASGAVQQGVGGAAQLGAGALGYQAPGAPQYGGAPYNATDMYGNITPSGLPTEVLGAPGMGRRLEQLKSAETARDAMRLLNPEIYAAGEAREKQNFARQYGRSWYPPEHRNPRCNASKCTGSWFKYGSDCSSTSR